MTLAAQLAALDRLPERRGAVVETLDELAERLDDLELRLGAAPRAGETSGLAEELEEDRLRIRAAVASLADTIASAPPPSPPATGRLRRTRRRGIFRAGGTFVVLEPDEHGARQARVAATLAEAIALRDALRAARRGPQQGYVERLHWEGKSSGGAGA